MPGGSSPAGEDIKAAATRECQEEVGIIPNKLIKLAMFYPNPSRTDWSANLFFCDDFAMSKPQSNDPSEIIEKVLMPITELNGLIRNQKIIDPSLIIAWFTAKENGYIKF